MLAVTVRHCDRWQVSHLCLGGFYSAALTDQGDLYTWGDGRSGTTGLDLSRMEDREVPKPSRVLDLGGARNSIRMLAAGVKHLIAVTAEGQCYSWGDGSLGRLGHGDTTSVPMPRLISTLKSQKVVSAAAGEEHSAATTSEGLLYTWGSGSFGKLGHGEPTDESTPRKVALDQLVGGARQVEKVGCGFAHTIAICSSYDVLVWGSGFKGKLGLGDDQNRLTPTPIPALKRKHIRDIACGSFHTIAVTETGDVFSWGIGERGQLGHGDLENHKTPWPILGLQGHEIGAIAAGEAHSLAASRDGKKVWAWGAGHYGQLGVGGLEPRLTPHPIDELENQSIKHVACGANHSGAVSDLGKVFTWGNGANSRLGNGLTDEQEVPQLVPALSKDALTNASDGTGADEPYVQVASKATRRRAAHTNGRECARRSCAVLGCSRPI
jgi:alpha-tubulin suppressor-like RCC1 family protein